MSSERRGGQRRAITRTSALFYRAERLVYARVFDVSPTGLGVRAPSPFRVGEELTVRIQAADTVAPNRAVELRVRVAWAAGLGMGVELLHIVTGGDLYPNLFSLHIS